MENNKLILDELRKQNQFFKEIFIFLLSREGYSDPQIRGVIGSVDNNRITKIRAGLKKPAKQK